MKLGVVMFTGSLLCSSAILWPNIANAEAVPQLESMPESKQAKTEPSKSEKCLQHPATEEWVDRIRSGTHQRMCRSAYWLDSLFGDDHEFDDRSFSGKLSVGFRQDEIDGFDPRIRVRIRSRLPNASKRLNAFIGRVEEDSFISNTEVDQDSISSVGLRSTNDDDSEWLLGLGYRNPGRQNNGFDYSVGAKISSGFNPYAKIRHRHLFKPENRNYWRTTQTLFWRRDEKFGFSSRLEYTKIINDQDIFEWDSSIKYTEEAEQWEWITGTSWHHSFSDTRGISSRVYVRGEDENVVSIPEFGLSLTYIREIMRPWLFLETGADLRWEKDQRHAEYKSAARVGIQLEMLLGDYYGSRR